MGEGRDAVWESSRTKSLIMKVSTFFLAAVCCLHWFSFIEDSIPQDLHHGVNYFVAGPPLRSLHSLATVCVRSSFVSGGASFLIIAALAGGSPGRYGPSLGPVLRGVGAGPVLGGAVISALLPCGVATSLPVVPKELLSAAQEGDAESQYKVGNFLCPEDQPCLEAVKRTAAIWFRKAAEQEHTAGMYKFGLSLVHGHGVETDLTSGFEWLSKSADKGFAPAIFRQALCYIHGKGVEKSVDLGLAQLERLAQEEGMVDAMIKLSDFYLQGRVVPEDHETALRWLRAAAALGRPEAHLNIGTAYYHGQGVPKDEAQAISWWWSAIDKAAAHPTNPVYGVAHFNLALAHQLGTGVPQDFWEAIRLYGIAANHGDERARFNQVTCYLKVFYAKFMELLGWKPKVSAVVNENEGPVKLREEVKYDTTTGDLDEFDKPVETPEKMEEL